MSLRRDEGPQQTRATFVERYVCIMDGGARGDGDGREEKESIGSNVKVVHRVREDHQIIDLDQRSRSF